MKKLLVTCVFALVAGFVVAPAFAQDPGDLGSVECRQAQLDVFEMVADHGLFENHGQLMRTINEFLNAKIHDRVISGGCAGCIRRQFASNTPLDEQAPCGEDPPALVIKEFAMSEFSRIRRLVDAADTSVPAVRFVGMHVEVASDSWVYVLGTTGRQVFRPRAVAPHMTEAFAEEIGPDIDAWAQQRVSPSTVDLAKEIAFVAFGAKYVFDPDTTAIPTRELITSKAAEWEMARSYEGRTSVLFRPARLENDVVESLKTVFSTSPDGEPVVTTRSIEVPSSSYETAVTFAPAGDVIRVESGFLTSDVREVLGEYQRAMAEGLILPEPVLYEQTLRFGGFFSPQEPRLELTAYSYEGENFLDPLAPYCADPAQCNPFWPYNSYEYCYDSPEVPDVNWFIRPSRQYKFDTFNIWHNSGRRNGIRGNWNRASQTWEIPDALVEVHASLDEYATLDPVSATKVHTTCDEYDIGFPFSTGNKLLQPFYDDLESCHVAMINTHGGPIESARIGRKTFQFLRSRDEWVTLHEEGDDGLGIGKLRHLFLETCSSINWLNNYRDDPKTLFTDFMNSHVADGVRTIGGFDGSRCGGDVTGWRFFGHYHAGESVSQAWFATGLEEYECNMPIVVAYGDTEKDAASILFDGRFSARAAGTGWYIAAEPITEAHLEARACCVHSSSGPSCVELSHADCEANGGQPLNCGDTCEEFAEVCQ